MMIHYVYGSMSRLQRYSLPVCAYGLDGAGGEMTISNLEYTIVE